MTPVRQNSIELQHGFTQPPTLQNLQTRISIAAPKLACKDTQTEATARPANVLRSHEAITLTTMGTFQKLAQQQNPANSLGKHRLPPISGPSRVLRGSELRDAPRKKGEQPQLEGAIER